MNNHRKRVPNQDQRSKNWTSLRAWKVHQGFAREESRNTHVESGKLLDPGSEFGLDPMGSGSHGKSQQWRDGIRFAHHKNHSTEMS